MGTVRVKYIEEYRRPMRIARCNFLKRPSIWMWVLVGQEHIHAKWSNSGSIICQKAGRFALTSRGSPRRTSSYDIV